MHHFSSFTNLKVTKENGVMESNAKSHSMLQRRRSFMTDAKDKLQMILQMDYPQAVTRMPDNIAKHDTLQNGLSGVSFVYPTLPHRIHRADQSSSSSSQSSDDSIKYMKVSTSPLPQAKAYLPLAPLLNAPKPALLRDDCSSSASRRTLSSICTFNASMSSLSSSSLSSPIDLDTGMMDVKACGNEEGEVKEKQSWSMLKTESTDHVEMHTTRSRVKDNIRKLGRRLLSRKSSKLFSSQRDRQFSPGSELVSGNEEEQEFDYMTPNTSCTPTLSYPEPLQQVGAPDAYIDEESEQMSTANLAVSPQIVITTPSTEYDADGVVTYLQNKTNGITEGDLIKTDPNATSTTAENRDLSLDAIHTSPSTTDSTVESSLDANTHCKAHKSTLITSKEDRQRTQEAALLPWASSSNDTDDDDYGTDEDEKTQVPVHPMKSKSKSSSIARLRDTGLNSAGKRAAYACTVLKFHPQLAPSVSVEGANRDLRIPRSINNASFLQCHPSSTSHQRDMRIGLARSILLRRLRSEPFPLLIEQELEWFTGRYLPFFIPPEKLSSRLARKAAESSMEALMKPPVKQGKKSGMAQWASRPRYDVRCGLVEDHMQGSSEGQEEITPITVRARLMPMELSKRCKALAGMIPIMKEEKSSSQSQSKKTPKKSSSTSKRLAPLWKRPSSRKGSEAERAVEPVIASAENDNIYDSKRCSRIHREPIVIDEEEDVPLLVLMKRQCTLGSYSGSSSTSTTGSSSAESKSRESQSRGSQAGEEERQLAELREQDMRIVDTKLRQSRERRRQQDRLKIYSASSSQRSLQGMSRSTSFENSKDFAIPPNHTRTSSSNSTQYDRRSSRLLSQDVSLSNPNRKPSSQKRHSALHVVSTKSTSLHHPSTVPASTYQYAYQPPMPQPLFPSSMPTQIISPYNMHFTARSPARYHPFVTSHDFSDLQPDPYKCSQSSRRS